LEYKKSVVPIFIRKKATSLGKAALGGFLKDTVKEAQFLLP
jgi:hypothetical protein